MINVLLGAAAGAAAYFYFWDARKGPERRAAVRERLAGLPGMAALGPSAPSSAPYETPASDSGTAVRADPRADTDALTRSAADHPDAESADGADADLAQKVRSEVFEALDIPHGGINVNAERGVVVLRGQVETAEEIAALEAATRRVAGVRDVDNRLHVPGAPIPG